MYLDESITKLKNPRFREHDNVDGGFRAFVARFLWCPSIRLLYIGLLAVVVLSACTPTLDVRVQDTPPATVPAAGEAVEQSEEAEEFGAESLEEVLGLLVTYLTIFAELCGALVIGVGVVRGLLRFIPHIFRRQPAGDLYSEDIRLQLGKSLALALEFALAADILKTAVAPTLNDIAQLAAIAFLRTFLNYFLERELRQAQERHAFSQRDGGPVPVPAEPPEPPGSDRPPAA